MPAIPTTARSPTLDELRRTVLQSKFRPSLGEMAQCFLDWEVRQIQMAAVVSEDGNASAWSRERLAALREPFADHFGAAHLNWAREDIDGAFGLLVGHCCSFAEWYAVVIASYGLEIAFDAGQPRIPIDNVRAWNAAADRVDPDAVVAFLFAKEGPVQDPEQVKSWPPIIPAGAHDFDEIMRRGIADLHVHIGGIRNAYIMWRKIVHDHDSLRHVARYAPRKLAKLLPDERRAVQRERDDIAELAQYLKKGEAGLAKLWNPQKLPSRAHRDEIVAEAATERLMLAQAWRQLLAAGEGKEKRELEASLDRYLFVKNRFLSHHRQPQSTNPGLGGFRRFFHSTERVLPKGRFNPTRFEVSPKFEARAFAEYASYIAQSRPLKRLELRISPKNHPAEYHRFFKLWNKVEKDLELRKNGCDIRFAVHFVRSFGSKSGDDASVELLKFLCDLDRASAQLHAYRRKRGDLWQENIHRISRIDFAGQERDRPVHLAALCMNLVRGQPDALRAIAGEGVDEKVHRFWRMHRARNEETQLVDRPRLGLTCHAGEDYAHPLEGIYSVASAVHLLDMSAGDSIGHGLALGQDIEKFNTSSGPMRLTTRGNQFDALLWLLFDLEANDFSASSGEIIKVRNFLLDEVREIYGRDAAGLHTLQDLRNLPDERAKPLSAARPPRADALARMRHAELTDALCAGHRAKRVPIHNIVYDLGPVLKRVQARQLKDLADKGIVLEFNPSSNLRVSGSGTMAETPFMAIIDLLQNNTLATLNTDNPGVFGTRIENEYAIVFSALREVMSRAEAAAVIERLRKAGLESVYWPRNPSERASASVAVEN